MNFLIEAREKLRNPKISLKEKEATLIALVRESPSIELLNDTRIGITVNKLRNHEVLGKLARSVNKRWKAQVRREHERTKRYPPHA